MIGGVLLFGVIFVVTGVVVGVVKKSRIEKGIYKAIMRKEE